MSHHKQGLIYYLVFRCPSALPHTKRRNLDTGSGLRHEASPAYQCACFYLLRQIQWKGPLFFLYFTQHLSSYRYHLYPLSYGYHLYPPNPKENVASFYEVSSTLGELLLALLTYNKHMKCQINLKLVCTIEIWQSFTCTHLRSDEPV